MMGAFAKLRLPRRCPIANGGPNLPEQRLHSPAKADIRTGQGVVLFEPQFSLCDNIARVDALKRSAREGREVSLDES